MDEIDQQDWQQPDEARPAKRVRLEAPLQVTADTRDEMQEEEDDWDDVYGEDATESNVIADVTASELTGLAQPPTCAPPQPDIHVVDQEHDSKTHAPLQKDGEQIQAGDIDLKEGGDVEEQDLAKLDLASPPVKSAVESLGRGQTDEADRQDVAMDDTIAPVSQPPKATEDAKFMVAAAAAKGSKDSEWQFDSSDAESSSDDDSSSDDSSDSDSGSDGGYEMLDAATAAKILMSGDGDDGDGGTGNGKQGSDQQPRTINEVKDEVIPKPDVTITPETTITLLGKVEQGVENMILIKGATPGEYQVLESGSVLCNEKREVVGVIAETIGRVQEPLYTVAFSNEQEVQDLGLKYGAEVFYVNSHSTFVFTQPLKNLKGTDASNIHDEEVAEDEQEFSDDEKEAEYKREKKNARKAGKAGPSRVDFNQSHLERKATYGAPGHDSGRAFHGAGDIPTQTYGGGMSYDDDEPADEFYAPLKRPDNLSELMTGGAPPPRPLQSFDRGRGRGRGDRGRGRGDRGRGRGRGRGGFEQQRGGRGAFNDRSPQHNRGSPQSYSNHHNTPSQQRPTQEAPQQQYHAPQQYQAQPQTYQFNGYAFQYNSHAAAPQTAPQSQQYAAYSGQQQDAHAPPGQLPAGTYANPAFFQAQHTQQQAQAQAYGAYTGQQRQYAAQPHTPAYPATSTTGQPAQIPDLGEILKQIGAPPPR